MSYSENIGAISLTRNGSRAVVQCAGIAMMVVGIISKIAGVLASMPTALVGGIYCTVFGLIIAVGLANLQFVNMNSERNLFIIGFALYNCLSIAGPVCGYRLCLFCLYLVEGGYFAGQEETPFGDGNGAQIGLALFSSPMIIALISAFTLDNLIPGTREERGLTVWDQVREGDVNNDREYVKAYSLPLFFAKLFPNCGYMEYTALGHFPNPPVNGYMPGRGDLGDVCCPCWLGPLPDVYTQDDNDVEYVDETVEEKMASDSVKKEVENVEESDDTPVVKDTEVEA